MPLNINNIYKQHKQGILGTILIHLLILVVLLSFKLHNIQQIVELELEMQQPEKSEIIEQEKKEEQKEEIRKKSSQDEIDKMLKSIVSNENADKSKPKQASDAELQKYIEETIAEIDGHKGSDLYKAKRDKNFKKDSLQNIRDGLEKGLDSLKSTFYQNGSSVSYKLGKRYARYLPIPVFKCENGGTIVIDIEVNPKGKVIKATVNLAASDNDEQLQETASDAALRSRFNEKNEAPTVERGTITYHFVKQ